jgi:hypothetical protein
MKSLKLFSLALLLAGCVNVPQGPIMIPGRMYRLSDGAEYDFSIESTTGAGSMNARNLKTGERFTGNYTAIFVDGGQSQGVIANQWGMGTGSVTTTTNPTRAVVKGILRSDKGTVILISLDVKVSCTIVNPSGFGEGKDNKGRTYQVQFGDSFASPRPGS